MWRSKGSKIQIKESKSETCQACLALHPIEWIGKLKVPSQFLGWHLTSENLLRFEELLLFWPWARVATSVAIALWFDYGSESLCWGETKFQWGIAQLILATLYDVDFNRLKVDVSCLESILLLFFQGLDCLWLLTLSWALRSPLESFTKTSSRTIFFLLALQKLRLILFQKDWNQIESFFSSSTRTTLKWQGEKKETEPFKTSWVQQFTQRWPSWPLCQRPSQS